MAARAFSQRTSTATALLSSAKSTKFNWSSLSTTRLPTIPTQIRCDSTQAAAAQGWKKKPKAASERLRIPTQEKSKDVSKFTKLLLRTTSPEFTPETAAVEHVRKMFRYPDNQIPALKEFGFPRFLAKHYAKFDKPVFCYRESTRNLLDQLDQQSKSANCKDRIVLCGESGVGKSAILLNVVSYYKSQNWFIYYIPNAVEAINGSMPYTQSRVDGLYDQATLAAKLMSRLAIVNAKVIEKMVTSHEHEITGVTLPKGSPMIKLFQMASTGEQAKAQGSYNALLKELTTSPIPVLIAVDEVNTLYGKSDYRDRESRPLTGENLTCSRLVLDFFEGKSHLANGIVVGAVTHVWTHYQSKSFDASLNYRQPPPIPHYENARKEILPPNYGSNLIRFDVPMYSLEEVETMMRHYDHLKLYKSPKIDEQYIQRWKAMSGGNAGELWRLVNRRLI